MVRKRGTLGGIVLLVAASSIPLALASGLGAAGASPVTPANIASLRTQAVAIENHINALGNQIAVAGEAYDEAEIALTKDRAELRMTAMEITAAQARVAAARMRLEGATISAYVDAGAASVGVGDFLTSSADNAQLISTYANTIDNNLSNAVTSFNASETRLDAVRATQDRQERAAAAAASTAHTSELAAERETADAQALLATVKGSLAKAVSEYQAQQEAIAAAAAAAALRREEAAQALAAKEAQEAQEAAQAAERADPGAGQGGGGSSGAGSSGGGSGTIGIDQDLFDPIEPVATAEQGSAAVSAAEGLIGVPYVWGGASRAGVDCSGLTMLAWDAAGVYLLHGATDQYYVSTPVSVNDLQPGDLLFYHFSDDGPWPITHVAMYVGSGPFGADTIIQAAETGTNVAFYPIYFNGLVAAGRP
jgi:peptidoglycan DL-endopeptidase CwlO